MIPRLDARRIASNDPETINALREAATVTGFATVYGTGISADRVREILELYRAFFKLPESEKAAVDMAKTGANRGWGAARSEQVNPQSNPDFKEVFDMGFVPPASDARSELSVYAPNLWPGLPGYREVLEDYFADACAVALSVLRDARQPHG